VLHPNVEEDIYSDLQLMRLAASFFQKRLKYLNLEGVADEFASLLKLQLDLRAEADHLVRFNQNFANEKDVLFPKVRDSHFLVIGRPSPSHNVVLLLAAGGGLQAYEGRLDRDFLRWSTNLAVCQRQSRRPRVITNDVLYWYPGNMQNDFCG
jgi:ABC1 atypical kinase-like domain